MEFINNGQPVTTWNGIDPKRIEKVLQFSQGSQRDNLTYVHKAMTYKKPLTVDIFNKAKVAVMEIEHRMSQRFMEVNEREVINYELITKDTIGMFIGAIIAFFIYAITQHKD